MKPIAPVKRSKEQARQYYNRISGIYDWLTSSEKALIEKGVKALSPQPGETILEIGCGPGVGLELIQDTVKGSCRLIGLDLARKMLRESQKKSKASLVQGDGAFLPLQGQNVEAVLCSFTLELFPEEEIPRVLDEITRVLTNNGRLVVVALSKEEKNLAVRLYEYVHRLFPVAVDCRPIPLYQILTEQGFQIQNERSYYNWGLPVRIITSKPV